MTEKNYKKDSPNSKEELASLKSVELQKSKLERLRTELLMPLTPPKLPLMKELLSEEDVPFCMPLEP